MDKTAPDLDLFRDYGPERGADEVMFKGYITWGNQDQLFTELALPGQRAQYQSPPQL